MNPGALFSFLNQYFESPLALILILLLIILMLMGRRRKITAPSRSVFELAEKSSGDRILTRTLFLLKVFLVFLLLTIQIVTLAGPRSVSIQVTEKKTQGRIAVLADDISGSMEGTSGSSTDRRIDVMIKANLAFLNEFCREEKGKIGVNYVGLVTFTDTASVVMSPTRECNVIRRRLKLLKPGGGTAIEKGLWQAVSLILSTVDKKRLISDSELRSVYASLYERDVRLPRHSKEFCNQYKGLSIELFTDGEFPGDYDTREKALQYTQGLKKAGQRTINPFNVIDFAKSLCIRTYFWSVSQLDSSYKQAFAMPPGGFAVLISDLNPKLLVESYRDAARKETGDLISEEVETYNPLKTYFLLADFCLFIIFLWFNWSKIFSNHYEGGGE